MINPNKTYKGRKDMLAIMAEISALIERDHGGCDQYTCTLGVAHRLGYDAVAIDHWIGCGAATDKANNLYRQLPKKFQAELKRQTKLLLSDVSHTDCPECNSVIWESDDIGVNCDSCGYGETNKVVGE